ncbi:hypothetical protein LTR64_001229 [Lithohypha guttulata]|uniref:uncharacterized protein n=1 Tax=Lithohypha guttulata TaxID=1690604 RepID=UPI002DDFA261|nr:hypothetical protein LTR51_003423 [Lithohypha guttulata]
MANDNNNISETSKTLSVQSTRNPTSDKDVELDDCSDTVNETTEHDSSTVDWDGPQDPNNPLNWTLTVKWVHIIIVSIMTLFSPLASTMFAPGAPQVSEEFHNTNSTVSALFVCVYLLGWTVGPLVIAPCSELYGRTVVYHVSNIFFIIFSVACALSASTGMLIAFRFLAGCAGIAPVTNGAGTIADLMPMNQRGAAMALWTLGPVIGPIIGPVAGGFLAESLGWRWILWVFTIAYGLCVLLGFVFLRETYAPVLLQRRVLRLRRTTGNADLRSKLDNQLSARVQFLRAIVRPLKLMCTSVICGLLSLYNAILYGIMFLLFTTFPQVFQEGFGFSESSAGLAYIGVGVGLLIGLAINGLASDRILKRLAKRKNHGESKPESRLLIMGFLGPLAPVGLVIYGWTAEHMLHWIVPLFGTALVGIGLISSFLGIMTYIVVSELTTFEGYNL